LAEKNDLLCVRWDVIAQLNQSMKPVFYSTGPWLICEWLTQLDDAMTLIYQLLYLFVTYLMVISYEGKERSQYMSRMSVHVRSKAVLRAKWWVIHSWWRSHQRRHITG